MDKYRILVKGIVKCENKFLIVKKWYDDRIAEPFQWEFIDSPIEFCEAPDKAVIRSIQEQTGLTAMIDRILYTWTFTVGDVFNIGICYLCLASMDEIVLSEELDDFCWISRDEMKDYNINPKILTDMEKAGF